jgi:transketolase
MRAAFVRTLVELAAQEPRLLLLTGDLGYTALEPFAERYPARFFNVGVAEQNLVGLATGLAEGGFVPFVYSIATFLSLRAYEFIRNGPVLHRLPVRLVGLGAGLEYGPQGITHHGIDDLGVLRLQPGLMVISPADHRQTVTALRATWEQPGPIYYRLGKDDVETIPGLDGRFALGEAQVVREGDDLLFLTMGSVSSEVVAAADVLATRGVRCTVAVVACLNPTPSADLTRLLGRYPVALTVEAHYAVGGLGSVVCELVAAAGLSCRVVRCGLDGPAGGYVGSQRFLWHAHGLSREALVDRALEALVLAQR